MSYHFNAEILRRVQLFFYTSQSLSLNLFDMTDDHCNLNLMVIHLEFGEMFFHSQSFKISLPNIEASNSHINDFSEVLYSQFSAECWVWWRWCSSSSSLDRQLLCCSLIWVCCSLRSQSSRFIPLDSVWLFLDASLQHRQDSGHDRYYFLFTISK